MIRRSLSKRHTRIGLFLICLLYLLITLSYGIINPLFETPDEHWHFFTVEYIATTGKLPSVADGAYDEWLSQEAAQPPLYYLIGAPLIAGIDTSQAREQVWLNPFSWIGAADALHNVNRTVHTPLEKWPWHGYALAAHLLRGLSTLFGLGTLLAIYGSARLLWPRTPHKAVVAVAMIAFVPQFNFIHSAVSNDGLITLLCAAAIWQLLRLWFTQFTWQRLLLLGVTIGLAALTKNAGVLLLVFACGMLGALTMRDRLAGSDLTRAARVAGQTAVFVILPTLLIAGWLWLRNHQLYGDWTATEPFIHIAGGDRSYTLWQVLRESGGLWTSFFAIFGWFNLRAPEWVYGVWNGIVGVAIAGFGYGLLYRKRKQSTVNEQQTAVFGLRIVSMLLAGWLLAVYAGLVMFMLRTEAAQGRLLFPAIVPIALGLAYGLTRWHWAAITAPVFALITTLACLFFIIRPAYGQPSTATMLSETAVSLNADMGQGLTLVGAEVVTVTAVPADMLTFTLYWRADKRPANPPEFKLELLGGDLETPLAEIHSYHGRGLYPATLWPLGEIVVDTFTIRLTDEVDAPVLTQAFVRLVEENGARREGVRVGQVKIIPTQWPPLTERVLAQIGDRVQVTAVSLNNTIFTPGEEITIDMTWQVIAPLDRELTTLVHLAHPGQPPLATGDNPPRAGSYPTQVWSSNEVIQDRYTITIPDGLANGRYPLWIGLYDSETVVPLPVWVDGEMQADGRLLVGWIEVKSD
jgi:hypothetical protein